MSKILITGNGFDLFHGLPTKYGHFMAIMETIEKDDFKEKVTFEDLFERYFKERFPKDYNLIESNYFIENISFERKETLEISKLLESNKWYKHFKTVNHLNTWIDFENEIENVLNLLNDVINDVNTNILDEHSNFSFNTETTFSYYKIKEFQILNIYSESIFDYKIDPNRLNKRDKKINVIRVLEELRMSLDEFINIFKVYLEMIVSQMSDHLKIKTLINFDLMEKIYTFNYTSTIEKLYKYKRENVVYLHGNLILNNLVLGISNIPIILKNNKSYGFLKNYQRIVKKSNNEFIELPNFDDNNLEETIFYVIGHSLDESDKYYVISLFEFLKRDKNAYSKVIIFYYDEQDYRSKLNNLFNIVESDLVVEMNKNERLCFEELNIENLLLNFQMKTKNKKSKKIRIYS